VRRPLSSGKASSDTGDGKRVHPVEDAEPCRGSAGPREQDPDDDQADEDSAPPHPAGAAAPPRDEGDDQEHERRQEDDVAEGAVGAETIRDRVLADRSLVIGLVDGVEGAVPGQPYLDDDGERDDRGPDAKCAVQLSSSVG
jgi:hypothetical protein